MTKSTNPLSGLRTRLPALLERLHVPLLALSGVVIAVGVVAVLADQDRTAIVMVLLAQGCVVLMVAAHHLAAVRTAQSLAHRIDQASARQLADLARTRHALLSGTDDSSDSPR
ncbi:hypothetical protein [Aeromicrobium sp. NPDC092404]|uniref:hypothetical protein n=1 Tax=Aeromicrobium sp. NPDC092404 TaxID=3154976 RepID=UPI00344875F2